MFAHVFMRTWYVMCNVIDDYVEHEQTFKDEKWFPVRRNANAFWGKCISDSEIKTGIEYKPSQAIMLTITYN